MKTELLLISQVFYPDETATASILTDIAVELAKRTDIKVSVWCGQPSYSTTERQKKLPNIIIYLSHICPELISKKAI